jgi:hypothetical protein
MTDISSKPRVTTRQFVTTFFIVANDKNVVATSHGHSSFVEKDYE